MQSILVIFLLSLAAPLWAQSGNEHYSITADAVRSDTGSNITTYEGSARAEILDLVIEADTISIAGDNGIPTRIEANGSPIRFHRRGSGENLNGTAQRITFSVADLKLTLIDYVVTDPKGNNMKGGKATFVLSP